MLTAALLALFTLLCMMLSADRAWDNETRPERNALVFDGRNRSYGAFALRREYDRRFMWAFIGAIGFFAVGVAVPKALGALGIWSSPMGIPLPPIVTEWEMEDPIEPPKAPDEPRPSDPRPGTAAAPILPEDRQIIIVPKDSAITPEPKDTTTVDPTTVVPGPGTPGIPGPPTGPAPGASMPGSALGSSANPRSMAEVAKLPEFIGGHDAMVRFIERNIVFPETDDPSAKKEYVEFVVDEDGSVLRVRSKGRTSKAFSQAAERVVRQMPKWRPAELTDGSKSACLLVLPIEFQTR